MMLKGSSEDHGNEATRVRQARMHQAKSGRGTDRKADFEHSSGTPKSGLN